MVFLPWVSVWGTDPAIVPAGCTSCLIGAADRTIAQEQRRGHSNLTRRVIRTTPTP